MTSGGVSERAIRLAGRVFRTDVAYLAKGGLWSVLGQVSAAAIAFSLALITARYVPKEAYGEYKYVLSATTIIATFSLSGIGSAVFQSIAQGYRNALGAGFKANLKWSLAVFVGALAVAIYHFARGQQQIAIAMLLSGCAAPFIASFGLYTSLLAGKKDFLRRALYGDLITNLAPALLITAAAVWRPHPVMLISAYVVGNLSAAAFAYWRSVRRYPPDPHGGTDEGLLRYSKHLSAIGVLSGVANNLDDILLFHFLGPVDLALYAFAVAIPEQTKSFFKTLNMMLVARFVERTPQEIRRGMGSKMLWLGLATVGFTVIYVAAAPLIYRIFFPRYEQAAPYSQIFAISIVANVFLPAQSYLSSKKKVAEQYLSEGLGSVFQIAVVVAGVLIHGLLGLVVARVIVRLANRGYGYWLYTRAMARDEASGAA